MHKIILSFTASVGIIGLVTQQACVSTAVKASTQCAKPTLIPSDATSATLYVRVRITTKTAGAYVRYTLDGSTPTGGPSGNGTEIPAASGEIEFTVGAQAKRLRAIAYKPGLADSPVAEGTYVYQSPY